MGKCGNVVIKCFHLRCSAKVAIKPACEFSRLREGTEMNREGSAGSRMESSTRSGWLRGGRGGGGGGMDALAEDGKKRCEQHVRGD